MGKKYTLFQTGTLTCWPCSRLREAKAIPCWAAHPRISNIWEYPPPLQGLNPSMRLAWTSSNSPLALPYLWTVQLLWIISSMTMAWAFFNPFSPKLKKCILPNFKKQSYERCSKNLYSIITFHLSKLCKVKFSILCDVIFLVRLQGNFDIDHSQEWKG